MLVLALTGLLLSTPAGCGFAFSEPVQPAGFGATSDSLGRLYAQGQSFGEFLAGVKSRRETWTRNYAGATIAPALLERVRAVPGHWRLLVVAEDWCGDSANTIPYLARLTDSVQSVALRIVSSREGRWVMEGHHTPDGRAATPTIILLDSAGAEAGCFVERPAALREWMEAAKARVGEAELPQTRDAWRRNDAGQSTLREIVELLEAAVQGSPRCGGTGD